jgi:hypothetical protein
LAEGASKRGEVGEQGARLKRGAGARTRPENARTWARPRRGIVGKRLGTADSGVEGTEREASERARETAPTDFALGAARERGREGTLELVPTGGAHLSGTKGGWAGLG